MSDGYDLEEEAFAGPNADAEELRFLRYFYRRVGNSLGPSEDDIRDMIKYDFIQKTGVDVPPAYYPPVE